MSLIIESIYLIGFYIEAIIIFKIEKQIWKTIYTPINILMLPYAILLPISIIAISVIPQYSFFYPSILIWCIGLAFWEIPSIIMNKWLDKYDTNFIYNLKPINYVKSYIYANICLVLIISFKLFKTIKSGLQIGTDEFAEAFATYGLWGHLIILLMIFTIFDIIVIDKNNKYFKQLFICIFTSIIIIFCNQVKGWTLIPIISGIIGRLIEKKLKISLKTTSIVIILGSSIFFLSYYASLVINSNNTQTDWFWSFIWEHFIFYLTSGINGLSQFCKSQYFDYGNILWITESFFPLTIVIEILMGVKRSGLIAMFIETGYGESNVRTFFGDLFIFSGPIGYLILSILFSFLSYLFLVLTQLNKDIFIRVAYCFVCGLLSMGWFSTYTNLLTTYEVPLYCLILYLIFKIYPKKEQS